MYPRLANHLKIKHITHFLNVHPDTLSGDYCEQSLLGRVGPHGRLLADAVGKVMF